MFPQFKNLPKIETGRQFCLSWSHYLTLMRINNIEERHFYEIEAVKNNWSLWELKRQYNSSLCERLALSKDKESVLELASRGQMIEHPKSLVKNRAMHILATNAKWDNENCFDSIISGFLMYITDEKSITSRQCIKALV